MAMRLTDTDKWKAPWFRNLPGKMKLFFLYAMDECDNAGVLPIDQGLISFILKENVTIAEIKEHLSLQVIFLSEEKLIIKNFVRHQHNENNDMMKKNIEKTLTKHGIKERYDIGEFH